MSELESANEIWRKVLEIFPESLAFLDEGNRDLPYITMSAVADYLESVPNCHLSDDLIERVKKFDSWAIAHPRGEDASDDVLTIYTVGFIEKLFESSQLAGFIPHIFSRADLINNKDYWIAWTGAASYADALSRFDKRGLPR